LPDVLKNPWILSLLIPPLPLKIKGKTEEKEGKYPLKWDGAYLARLGLRSKESILIVDEEKEFRESLKATLNDHYQVFTAERSQTALDLIENNNINIVLLSFDTSDGEGVKFVKKAKEIDEDIEVVLVSHLGMLRTLPGYLRLGASFCITKSTEGTHLISFLKEVLIKQRVQKELECLRSETKEPHSFGQIISKDKKMREIFGIIKGVASTSTSILITGESGTGKELVARAIHYQGNRKDKPFVTVNCGAIPSELMESELFGYEKGAFTGAQATTLGKFEYANGGTLFLDELSALRLDLQSKLLRVLQEKQIQRIGSNKTINLDVRVIATTNLDLQQEVRENRFREDLYFRLNVVPIHLPPLRNRKIDIPLLAEFFLERYNKECNKNIEGFSPEAMGTLCRYPWPGNVRELQNLTERLVVLSRQNRMIYLSNLPIELFMDVEQFQQETEELKDDRLGLINIRQGFEKRLILQTLEKTNWNQTETAKTLKIHRNTLIKKLKQLNIRNKA
jgi:two-component system response regulator AtoC